MADFMKWIRAGAAALDPGRDRRVAAAAEKVEKELAVRRKEFALDSVVRELELFIDDVPLVAARVYKSLLQRAWRDHQISDGERKMLDWAAGVLGIDSARRRSLEQEAGLAAVEHYLGTALSDGQLTTDEVQTLHSIAHQLGYELGALLRHYFRDQSAGLLRGMFIGVSESEEFSNRIGSPFWLSSHRWASTEVICWMQSRCRASSSSNRP
jgi:hypothetical protein